MSSKVPTAQEVLNSTLEHSEHGWPIWTMEDALKAMKKYAQLHVKAALEAAYNNAQVAEELGDNSDEWIVKDSIINAYPEKLLQ